MLPFDRPGVFWLPNMAERRVPGQLSFESDRVSLRLFGAMRPFEMRDGEPLELVAQRVDEPLLHGRFHDGELVSVLGITGAVFPAPEDEVSEQHFRASAALLGGHASGDAFGRALIGFDALPAWADPPQIALEGEGRSHDEIVVRMRGLVLGEADCSDHQVRLVTKVVGRAGPSVHLDQEVVLEITGDLVSLGDLVTEWIRPLHDLLIVCLGGPVAITQILLEDPAAAADKLLSVAWPAVQLPAVEVSAAAIRSYDRPTMLLPEDVPFGEMVQRWCELREELSEVVTQLCSPFYAPFIYNEHRYSSTYQAAEALAKKRYPGAQQTKSGHNARVQTIKDAAVAAAVDPEIIDWAVPILQSRNDRTLRELIADLVADSGAVGERALAACSDLGRLMTAARAGVSHGGAEGTTTVTRYWLGEVLLWILRLHLVRELGLPDEKAQERVLSNPSFTYAIGQLSSADV